MMKKPSVISGLGLAACLAFAGVLLFPSNGSPEVQAATIMRKLNEQIEQNPLIEVTLNSLNVDEAFINGRLQVSNQGVAGDIEVRVEEGGPDQVVEVDLALGISDSGGWILIRKLQIPDPDAQAILSMFLPPDGETLLLLPQNAVGSDFGLDIDDLDELSALGSDKVVDVLKRLIDAHADYGAEIEHQADGTILLTMPIDDAEALAALERLAEDSLTPEGAAGTAPAVKADIELGDEDELIGSTLSVVYDPQAEVVRSFGIHNFGGGEGSIEVTIGEGEIDPALFDSSRVTTPNTRTLDLSALESMFKNFQISTD